MQSVGEGVKVEKVVGVESMNSLSNVKRRSNVQMVKGQKLNQTYPHIVKLSDWQIMMGWDVEEKDEEKVKTMVSNWGAEIVEVEKGGNSEYYVIMLTLGPNAPNIQFTPYDPKEKSKEKAECNPMPQVEGKVPGETFSPKSAASLLPRQKKHNNGTRKRLSINRQRIKSAAYLLAGMRNYVNFKSSEKLHQVFDVPLQYWLSLLSHIVSKMIINR